MNNIDDTEPGSSGNSTWQSLGHWTLWHDGLGKLTAYGHYFKQNYAGGFIIVGVGYPYNTVNESSWDSWNLVVDLERHLLALRSPQTFRDKYWYLNSHISSDAIPIWVGRRPPDAYESTRIAAEQEFEVVNLGRDRIAIKATGGPYKGHFMTAVKGGGYAQDWRLGNGYATFGKHATTPGPAETYGVSGSMVPVLRLTNSARENDLSHENLSGLDLTNADFSHAKLTETRFAGVVSISGVQFEGAAFEKTVLDGLDLGVAKGFDHATFSGCDLRKVHSSAGAVLNHATFSTQCNLNGVTLTGAKLAGARFNNVVLDGVDLTGADLTGAVFDTVSLHGTIFRTATLASARFTGCDLSTAVFDDKPDFRRDVTDRNGFTNCTLPFRVISDDWSYLDLTGSAITDIPESIPHLNAGHALLPDRLSLVGKKLMQANFEGARMHWIQLTGANLEKANLKGALLKGAKLDKANLSVANLSNAYLLDESVSDSDLPGLLRDNKASAATVTNAFLIDVTLDGAHCDGVDFSGVLMPTYAGFSDQPTSALGTTFNLATFDNAVLVEANFDGAHCAGATFSGAVMVAATFRKAHMTPQQQPPHKPASVYKAILLGTNFDEANMDGLDMADASVASTPGNFTHNYKDFDGKLTIFLNVDYGKTVYGETTNGTTCPDGTSGPCKLPAN
jgi:uncharacterized protein YjbI with pentapeptide repeats